MVGSAARREPKEVVILSGSRLKILSYGLIEMEIRVMAPLQSVKLVQRSCHRHWPIDCAETHEEGEPTSW